MFLFAAGVSILNTCSRDIDSILGIKHVTCGLFSFPMDFNGFLPSPDCHDQTMDSDLTYNLLT